MSITFKMYEFMVCLLYCENKKYFESKNYKTVSKVYKTFKGNSKTLLRTEDSKSLPDYSKIL